MKTTLPVVTLALHALPADAQPQLTADGQPVEVTLREGKPRVFCAEIPADFRELQLTF